MTNFSMNSGFENLKLKLKNYKVNTAEFTAELYKEYDKHKKMLQQYAEGTEAYQFTKEKLSKIESLLEKLDTEIKGSELYQQTEAQISDLYNSIIDTINNAGSNIPSTDNNPVEQPAEQPVEQPVEQSAEQPAEQPPSQNTNVDISVYNNKSSQGFVVTTGNKTYDLSEEDKELLYAIVAAESDKTPDDALAVASTILNRCESSNWTWIKGDSSDPIAQATASNQFVVYQHGYYKKYMNGNAPKDVVEAVDAALAGVRNHDYESFRSNGTTGYSSNMITSTGNRYK